MPLNKELLKSAPHPRVGQIWIHTSVDAVYEFYIVLSLFKDDRMCVAVKSEDVEGIQIAHYDCDIFRKCYAIKGDGSTFRLLIDSPHDSSK